MNDTVPVLIIVHPGSACGSADMNLGRENADIQRCDMICSINEWRGGVLVIDSDFSDELSGFGMRREWQELGNAIDQALSRASQAGGVSGRIVGNDASDFTQMEAAVQLVHDYGLTPSKTPITLTGAWVHDNGDGCVNSVRDALGPLGFEPQISGAMNFDLDLTPEFDDDDQDIDMPPPALRHRSLR